MRPTPSRCGPIATSSGSALADRLRPERAARTSRPIWGRRGCGRARDCRRMSVSSSTGGRNGSVARCPNWCSPRTAVPSRPAPTARATTGGWRRAHGSGRRLADGATSGIAIRSWPIRTRRVGTSPAGRVRANRWTADRRGIRSPDFPNGRTSSALTVSTRGSSWRPARGKSRSPRTAGRRSARLSAAIPCQPGTAASCRSSTGRSTS